MSLLVLFCSLQLKSQISEGGIPPSFLINLENNIDHIVLPTPDVEQLKIEDEFFEKNGEPERIGVPIPVGVTPENAGTWTELPNGDRIWRLEIESKGAKSIGVYYDSFQIPENGKLFLYSADKKHVIGAFTNNNNPKRENFATQMVYSDKIIIEYNESAVEYSKSNTANNLKLDISNIIYFYKGLNDSEETKASDPCEVNVICSPVGDNWQDEKRGVALMEMSGYVCSGSLINNTNQDCTPYFLSAYHCSGDASAAEHNAWVFYFNYEASTCTGTTSAANSLTGCSLVAISNTSGGSDLQLLELNSTPPESWNPYYNGWDRSTSGSGSGAGIHHPAGDIKKISTYTSTLTSSSPNISGSQMQTNSAWRVVWSSNANGWGVTEGGSSGSPIFSNSGLIVGTLSGGSSYCTAQTQPDYYGKFDYHWTNGSLASYLDPAVTGATTLAGTNAPCNPGLMAEFVGTPTTVIPGGSVTFTDNSTGSPTTWNWTFTGGSPSSSTSQTPPAITYANAGTYTVSLYVSDGSTNDTETKVNYITVSPPSSGFSLDFEACSDFSTDFSPWTVNDVGGVQDYSMGDYDFTGEDDSQAFVAFNPSQTTPTASGDAELQPHGGSRFGACFNEVTASAPNNDWLISSQLQLGTSSSIDMWVKTYTDQWGFERYKVGVSTTNNDPGSFTFVSSGSYEEAPAAWTQRSYDLSAYDNQSVYIGINCVSNDAFVFMIDDIEINTTGTSIDGIKDEVQNISIYPNPASDYINVVSSFSGENMQITFTNMIGEIIDFVTYNNFSAGEYKIDMSKFDAGIYYININADNKVISEKITLIK